MGYRHMKLIVLLIILSIYHFHTVQGESTPKLPNDLIFAVGRIEQGQVITNALVRVNKQTLKESVFYSNKKAVFLIPLSWSPKANLLAVFMRTADETRQVCLVNAQGVEQSCFTGKLPSYSDTSRYNINEFPVTWSQD